MKRPLRAEVRGLISQWSSDEVDDDAIRDYITEAIAEKRFPGPLPRNMAFAFASAIEYMEEAQRARIVSICKMADAEVGDIVEHVERARKPHA